MNDTQKAIRSKTKVKSNLLPVEERINNFQEVNLGYLNLDEVIEECKRCYQCFSKSDPNERPPPCMKYCPTHCNSRDIIKNVLEGKINEALNIIYKHYPFPRCVERVCPGYCQLHCTAGKKGDPIQIPIIKRYLVDHYGPNDEFFKSEPLKLKKVAVIGSGPLGLTTAYFLKKAGIEVTIFEKMAIVGGMLYLEIPEFRLPRTVLNEEIENLKKLGIEIITNKGIDEKHSLEELFLSGYNMVVIGIGTHKPNWMQLPGEDSQIILQAIEFLKDFHLTKNFPDFDDKKVLVVGGGSTATDAARVAKRLGADVSILYRREKEQMPAGKTEIADSEDEGIIIKYLTTPIEFVCIEEEFQGAVCKRMELGEPDSSGKPIVIPLEDSEFREEADFIIEAIGQRPDLTGFDTNKIKVSDKSTIIVNEEFYTSVPNVLAGGDCVSGSKSVVEAVAHGKIIADQIISYFSDHK
ncbi:MAG: dihydropyrimidine dehydrogenase [Candidatus Lokiarchaeota archaeon]|nr:dihydropyrimidine dehydrogenase [Candidatus Lokiarchaeota archaeon]